MDYKIMHKDDVIALANENGIYEIIDAALCPACFADGMPIEIWLDNRILDVHRSHSRKLFKALRLRTPDNIEQVINIGHGISITDNWWIQKVDENLDYRLLKSYNERISDIALYGSSDSISGDDTGYRELGTVGSYEKAWRYIDGNWYMYKQGNTQELISEYYSYAFLKKMGAPVAEYEIKQYTSKETGITSTFIITQDFTNNAYYDFEPFCNYYTNDNDEPEYIIPKLDEKLIVPYVMMVFYDALLHNGDRHNQNVGVLRDSTTGELQGLAPYFDYNLSLISTGVPRIDAQTGNMFTEALLSNTDCCKVIKNNLPERELIKQALDSATSKTAHAFGKNVTRYVTLEHYIYDTYDYISKNL